MNESEGQTVEINLHEIVELISVELRNVENAKNDLERRGAKDESHDELHALDSIAMSLRVSETLITWACKSCPSSPENYICRYVRA